MKAHSHGFKLRNVIHHNFILFFLFNTVKGKGDYMSYLNYILLVSSCQSVIIFLKKLKID